VVLALVSVAKPATAQAAPRLARVAMSDTSANTVTVQNDRNVPVTVYMEYGQFDRRLGIVPKSQTATLPLPAWAVRGRTRIQLFAHAEGDVDDLETRQFSLESPARMAMTIPARGGVSLPTDTMMAVIPQEELADATLTVDNPRSKPVTVFAEQGPFDARLGRVPANSRVTLRFPKSVVFPDETILVFVHPEGGLDLSSETLKVRSGEHLGLRVPLN
jgi:hypothetical protein